VNNLHGRIKRLIDAYDQGLIELSEFEPRVVNLCSQLNRENAALASLQGEHATESDPDAVAATLTALAASVSENLATATYDLKRSLLKLLIQRIEICEEEIRIVYRVPPNPFVKCPESRGNIQHWLSLSSAALG